MNTDTHIHNTHKHAEPKLAKSAQDTEGERETEGERASSDTNQSNYHFKKAGAPSERPPSFIETTQKNKSSGRRNASKVQAVISNTHTYTQTLRRSSLLSLCAISFGR